MTNEAPIGTVMLIDDEKADQMMYRRVLKRSGLAANYVSFQYAEEALEYLKKDDREDIDLIFLDINMPRMNGFEFLEVAVRDLGPDFAKVVVVMLTTSLDPQEREKAENTGIVREFINKPLTKEKLEYLTKYFEEAK